MQEEYKEFSSFEDIENWNTSEKFDQAFLIISFTSGHYSICSTYHHKDSDISTVKIQSHLY